MASDATWALFLRKNSALGFALGFLLLSATCWAAGDDKDKKPAKNAPQHPAQTPANNKAGAKGNGQQGPNGMNVYQNPNRGTSNQNTGQPNNNYRPGTTVYRPSQPSNTSKGGTNPTNQPYGKTPSSNATGGTTANPNSVKYPNTYTPGNSKTPYSGTPGNNVSRGPSNIVHPDVRTGLGQKPVFHEAPRTIRQVGDKQVAFDRGGRLREVHARGLDVHRGVGGDRRFVAEHNGRRIVGLGRRDGFMERRYVTVRGRTYVQRTYIVGGVRYARAYRTYYWHGTVFYSYAPVYYYHPAFYVWAFNPWPAPVVYTWGWGPAPWYGFYSYYFTPYPTYASASLWLTDYMISENLRLAYENQQNAQYANAQQDAAAAQDGSVQLTPEVKQAIADEVQRQLSAEQAAANPNAPGAPPTNPNADENPTALDPNHKLFVVGDNLDVVAEDGSECTLTAGDVIQRTTNVPDGTKVTVNVITSKRGDCAGNTNVAVEVGDLQEMQNRFREQMDAGLKQLADNQGKNGLPAAPDTGTTAGDVPAPTPDATTDAELQDEQKAADKAEADVKASGPSPGSN